MTEGLFDRYFRLLAGQLPAAEYGVIAEPTVDAPASTWGEEAPESQSARCLC